MFIARGFSRIVFCFPSLGIVVKIPRPRIWAFLETTKNTLVSTIRRRHLKEIKWAFWLNKENDTYGNIRHTILNGTYHNWKEATLWNETHSPFLEPTFFSFFGLINIQKYGENPKEEIGPFWCQIMDLSEGKAWSNGHHFSNPDNYSLRDGKLRMVDYGDRGVKDVVVEYGEKISSSFRPGEPET